MWAAVVSGGKCIIIVLPFLGERGKKYCCIILCNTPICIHSQGMLSGGKKKKLLHQFYAICPFVSIVFHICRGLEKNFGSVHTVVAGEFGQHWHLISCTTFSCTARGRGEGNYSTEIFSQLENSPNSTTACCVIDAHGKPQHCDDAIIVGP